MMESHYVFAGIEGGATHSQITLIDGTGKLLVTLPGPATNHWLNGMEECQKRVKNLVDEAKSAANIPSTRTLDGLGLCMSGCEQQKTNEEIISALKQKYPGLATSIYVASDTIGSLKTACRNGGVILISGTGSNALLMNPDGSTYHSGGWGHLLGDEASGFWVAHRGVKLIYDEEDQIVDPPHSTECLRSLVFEHFNLKDRSDILEHLYKHFQKQHFASLTVKISDAAANGDKMCLKLMDDTGFALGRSLSALSSRMDKTLFDGPNGLEVICTGSVFKSWDLLSSGFKEGLNSLLKRAIVIPRLTLLKLQVTSAVGAAYEASRIHGYELPRDYSLNSTPFFSMKN